MQGKHYSTPYSPHTANQKSVETGMRNAKENKSVGFLRQRICIQKTGNLKRSQTQDHSRYPRDCIQRTSRTYLFQTGQLNHHQPQCLT